MSEKIIKLIQAELKKNNIKSINIEKSMDMEMRSLGIDSLVGMSMIVEIENTLGVMLDDKQLMGIKTIGDLVKVFATTVQD